LNHLPEVKRFVKEAGHADSYNEITVKYIPGMKPEFVIFDDDGSELERHKLWGPDANRGMNAMMDCPPDSGTKPGGGCGELLLRHHRLRRTSDRTVPPCDLCAAVTMLSPRPTTLATSVQMRTNGNSRRRSINLSSRRASSDPGWRTNCSAFCPWALFPWGQRSWHRGE